MLADEWHEWIEGALPERGSSFYSTRYVHRLPFQADIPQS